MYTMWLNLTSDEVLRTSEINNTSDDVIEVESTMHQLSIVFSNASITDIFTGTSTEASILIGTSTYGGSFNRTNIDETTVSTPYTDPFTQIYSTVLGETSSEVLANKLTLAVVLSFFCLATVFGNVLVMVAVAREPYLHTVTNYFIASLATADCIVGAVVMPFCVVLEVNNNHWPFGADWCDVWRSMDVLASTASILNLCVISLDRYWAITDSMSYPSKMTPTKAGVLIALVWVCSSLISFPAIAWWRAVSQGPPAANECHFTEDVGYLVFSSAVSFYVPLTVMVFTYYRIYKAAVEQKRSLKSGMKQVNASNGRDHRTFLTLRIHRGGVLSPNFKTAFTDNEGRSTPSSEDGVVFDKSSVKVPTRHMKSFSLSRKLSKLAKERKAAKTLGIVMGVFILCWLPFFVTNVLMGICGDRCVVNSELVLSVVTWLGWTNSGMNPVIYACWSRDFRRAFIKLLCFCCPVQIRGRQKYRTRLRQAVRDEMGLPTIKLPPTPVHQDVHL